MPAPTRPYVTVVSGVPRSGTSMMMAMLAAGGIPPLTDARRAADDDNPKGYFELERVKNLKADPSWVRDAVGHAVKVVHVHVRDLPADIDYRVVLMRRDLREVVTSQRTMLARRGKPGGDLSDERLMAIYARQLDDLVAWMGAAPHIRFMEARYGAVLADPTGTLAALDGFLDGGLDRDAMARCVDPSLYRS